MVWALSNCQSAAGRRLADRHYSRQTPGSARWIGPGVPLALVTLAGDAVWGALFQQKVDHEWPGAWQCTIFRNESAALSSELITKAVAATRWCWGAPPAAGFLTFVDAEATAGRRSRRHAPGWCFRVAGFEEVGVTKKRGRIALILCPEKFPPPSHLWARSSIWFGGRMTAFDQDGVRLLVGDCRSRLRELDAESVQCCVTSPPYWGLRDYGVAGQLGREPTPAEYVATMVEVFREVHRVLRPDGVLWLNLGDSFVPSGGHADTACNDRRGAYNLGNRPEHNRREFRVTSTGAELSAKNLVGIPWRVAFALQADAWWLRSDVIWSKPNPMPESIKDRPTRAHEYLFLLTKSGHYSYDADAIREPATSRDHARMKDPQYHAPRQKPHRGLRKPGLAKNEQRTERRVVGLNARWDAAEAKGTVGERRNKRSVWTIATEPFEAAHFAVMPTALALPCVLAGSRPGDLVLDPFSGAGTVPLVAYERGRRAIGIDLNPAYAELAARRLGDAMVQGRLAL